MNRAVWPCFLLLIFSSVFKAQEKSKHYDLAQCINIAMKNNEGIKTASLNIDYQRQFRKAATEIPKTSVVYTQGQFNSIYKYDNNITISQAIPFPLVFSTHNALAKAHIRSSEYNYESASAELIYKIKSAYYSLLYFEAVHELLQREDSIYSGFIDVVNKKFEEGKGTLLEKISAETQVMEIQNQLLESEEDIQEHYIQLQTLLNTSERFKIENTDIRNSQLTVKIDSTMSSDHPILKYLKQQVIVSKKQVAYERARIMPDLMASYFNQSIYGPANIFGYDYFLTVANRLQGFQVGITLPLWFYPLKSKVETAKIGTRLAETAYDYQSTVLNGQYDEAVTFYLKYQKSINFYRKNALTNSKLIIEQALHSYNKGEISYVEYLQIVGHALNIENNYLNVINQNNMAVLKIEYLLTR
jgi:cobalt-zinc-cadmium resistance protein CzcA